MRPWNHVKSALSTLLCPDESGLVMLEEYRPVAAMSNYLAFAHGCAMVTSRERLVDKSSTDHHLRPHHHPLLSTTMASRSAPPKAQMNLHPAPIQVGKKCARRDTVRPVDVGLLAPAILVASTKTDIKLMDSSNDAN